MTAPAPWAFAQPWGATSYVTDLGGPVHWIDFGGESAAPPMVLVHGLGGSHLNWSLVGAALAEHRRVVAVDLGGFGLTRLPPLRATVQANARLVDRFVREIVGAPAILVGNSMGGMVSILQASARPAAVAGLVLIDPALPVPAQRPDLQVARRFLLYAVPGLGEATMWLTRRRTGSRELVQAVVDLCFADPSRASAAVIDAGVLLADERRTTKGAEVSFMAAARSLTAVLARPARYRAMQRDLPMPVLLVHGDRDRLVPVAAARKAAADNPHWDFAELTGVGHTPQLEVPDLVVDRILGWTGRHPTLAAR
ncbi:alpha/beta fold hydrolase [Actinokineospora sp.]|uniref:alpha/beta fold hydrolase n=1 Tax=Actinokineospora sp. TaxID=1872133 RepID=UPI0040382B2A